MFSRVMITFKVIETSIEAKIIEGINKMNSFCESYSINPYYGI
jgi:hypothetical protein